MFSLDFTVLFLTVMQTVHVVDAATTVCPKLPEGSISQYQAANDDICLYSLNTSMNYGAAKQECTKVGGTLPILKSLNDEMLNTMCMGAQGQSFWVYTPKQDAVAEQVTDGKCMVTECPNKVKKVVACAVQTAYVRCVNVTTNPTCKWQKDEENKDVCSYWGDKFGDKKYTYFYPCAPSTRCGAPFDAKPSTLLILALCVIGKVVTAMS